MTLGSGVKIMKAFTFTLLCALLMVRGSCSFIAHPHPCCDVVDLQSSNNMVSIFKMDTIFIPQLQTCSKTFVVQTMSKGKLKKNSTTLVTRSICTNGFNLVSFLISLLEHLGNKRTAQESELLGHLKQYIDTFSVYFTPQTADTSGFSLSVILNKPK